MKINRLNIYCLLTLGACILFSYPAQSQLCHKLVTKIIAPLGSPIAEFGFSVDISGDIAVVGAVFDTDNGSGSGSAYVYRYDGIEWVYQAKLTASDGEPDDNFGWSVSISADTIAIGSLNADAMGSNAGAVYIFKFNGTNWTERAVLYPSDPMPSDLFGWMVDLQGNALIVGAIGTDDLGLDSGSAYIFTYDGSLWSQQQKLLASDGAMNHLFGNAVSISGDTAVIGVPDDADNGPNSGSIYIFKDNGTNWVQQGKLLARDGVEGQRYGHSVVVSGTSIIVGAPYGSFNVTNLGSVYIYQFDHFIWAQQDKLIAPDGNGFSRFGEHIALSPDARTILVGAHGTNPSNTGAAYIYNNDGSGWVEQAMLLPSDGQTNDHFGFKVSLTNTTAIMSSDEACYLVDLNQPACPPDLNNDCNLNFVDVSAFLTAFGNQDPTADFSGDGLFNFLDVSAFLAAFGAGCP